MLAAAVLFGTTGTAQALGPDRATAFGIGGLRVGVGALGLWALANRRPLLRELRRHLPLVLVAALGVAAYQPVFFTGTSRAGVALGTAVALGSGPLFTGAIESVWLRRLPPTPWRVATALTLCGGVLVVAAGDSGARIDPVGLCSALMAGLSYAVYALAATKLIRDGVPSTVALAWPFTLAGLALLPFVLATQPVGWVLEVRGALMVAHLGAGTVGLAYFLYGYGLRTLDASTAVTLTLAEPLTAAVLGVVVLGEQVGPVAWAGAALILAGLAVAGGLFSTAWKPWGRRRRR